LLVVTNVSILLLGSDGSRDLFDRRDRVSDELFGPPECLLEPNKLLFFFIKAVSSARVASLIGFSVITHHPATTTTNKSENLKEWYTKILHVSKIG
jgi:hypothetical protein